MKDAITLWPVLILKRKPLRRYLTLVRMSGKTIFVGLIRAFWFQEKRPLVEQHVFVLISTTCDTRKMILFELHDDFGFSLVFILLSRMRLMERQS